MLHSILTHCTLESVEETVIQCKKRYSKLGGFERMWHEGIAGAITRQTLKPLSNYSRRKNREGDGRTQLHLEEITLQFQRERCFKVFIVCKCFIFSFFFI